MNGLPRCPIGLGRSYRKPHLRSAGVNSRFLLPILWVCLTVSFSQSSFAQQQPTATTITTWDTQVPQGMSPTLTVFVSGSAGAIPSGSVTLFDGTTPIATATLDTTGTAIITTDPLVPGTHLISSQYGGDGSNAPSVSSTVGLSVFSLPAGSVSFDQTDLSATSSDSWYGDNWYQLGTGFSGLLTALSIKCYVDQGSHSASGDVYLQEFADAGYTTMLNNFQLDTNGNPTCTSNPSSYDVSFNNLNITLNISSYYRLYTISSLQNTSVRLLGNPNIGYAMYDSFVYGVGRVENYYTFYPYMVPYVVATNSPVLSCPAKQSDHSNASPHNPSEFIPASTMITNSIGLWVAPTSGPYCCSESYITLAQDLNGQPGPVFATSNTVSLSQYQQNPSEAFYTFPTSVQIPAGSAFWVQLYGGPDPTNGTVVYGSAEPPGTLFIDVQCSCSGSIQTFGSPDLQLSYAEPVNTATGNYYYAHTDFTVPGRVLSLQFKRSYNALDSYSGPLGSNWTHNFNVILTDTGSAVTIKWGDGHSETYVLAGSGYAPPPGIYSTLLKNGDGSYTLTEKSQTKYNFSAGGKLSNVVDKNGNIQALVYDSNGNLIQISDTVGRLFLLSYNSNNQLTQISDPIGRKESFTYSSAGDLLTVTDFIKGNTSYAYDSAHHLTSITLPGNTLLLTNTYDSSGRVITQMNGRSYTTSFSYNTPAVGQTTIVDPLGNTTVHTYDNLLRITQITNALNGTIGYTYDANNDRLTVTNEDGNTTAFTYDGAGNVTSVTDALQERSSFTYDSINDLLTSTNPRGNSTALTYDAKGNLLTVQDALSDKTTFAYDTYGELTSKTDANGNKTTYGYDTQGNLLTVTDALGHATTMGYDGISRLTLVTDANGNKTTSTYDALNRLTKTKDPLGNVTQFKYSPVSNLTKVTDANGNATSYAYDAVNNLISVTDTISHVTKYVYDANNNRTAFTNANGKKTTYSFDKLNRLSQIIDPLKFITTYGYDPVGNLTSLTDANGHLTQFAFDVLNRLTTISYFDGTSVVYAYDADSDRTSMVDGRGTTTYGYDALDRITSVVQPGNSTVSYSYDPVGHRSALTYPDGKNVTYAYDKANRLSGVTDWLSRSTSYAYDPANRLTGTTYPNTAAVSFAYDSANHLTQVNNTYPASAIGTSAPFSSYTYKLDKVGNRTQVTDGAGNVTTYGYDLNYELTSVANASGTTTYTFDKVGNRLSLTSGTTTTSYSYDADDRLTTAGTTKFTYDKNGNRTKQTAKAQSLTYAYDAVNRLVSMTGGSQTSTFAYDGDGHRASQTVGTETYTYTNDIAVALPVVLQENGPDGFISYDYGLGLVSESGPTFDYFYHPDGLGSIVGLTDDNGTLQQGYVYADWGNDAGSTNLVGTANKFRYTGQALDPGEGLYFLRARYLDTATARLVTQDPLFGLASNPASLNRYKYALNNPIRFADTSGLSPLDSSPSGLLNNYLMAGLQDMVEKTSVDLVKGVSSRFLPAAIPSIDQDFARVVPFVGQALSIVQSVEDARNHPERTLLEDFQRGSIDLAFSATLSAVAMVPVPGAVVVSETDSVLYQANRVQVQNRILEDAGGWLTNLISRF